MDWSRASFRDASFENRWRVAKRKHQMPTYYSTCLATFAPLHAPLPFTINSFSWTAPSPPAHSCIFLDHIYAPLLPYVLFIRSPCYCRTTKQAAMTAQEATALKNKGNDAFKAQDWATAVEFYTKAIDLYDEEPSFYTNRAQVRSLTLHPVRTRPRLTIRLRPTLRWRCTDWL